MLIGVVLSEFLQKINVIIGIVLAIFGVASFVMAKRITQSVRKTSNVKKNDNVYITANVVGIILILLGMILIALPL